MCRKRNLGSREKRTRVKERSMSGSEVRQLPVSQTQETVKVRYREGKKGKKL